MSSVGKKGFFARISEQAEYSDQTTVRRHKPDYMIILYMGLLMLLGLIVLYAIGPQRANVLNNAYGYDYSGEYFFIKQLSSLAMALISFMFIAFIPYTSMTKWASKLLALAIIACIVLAVAGFLHLDIAPQSLGATRWFNLGPLGSLQPAEFLKFAMLIFCAGFLGQKARQGKLNDREQTLRPLGIITALAMFFIIVLQKDLGTGIALVGIISAMLFVGGLNTRNSLMIIAIVLLLGLILIATSPHRVSRVLTYIKGDTTTSDNVDDAGSYHIEQAKIAIGMGGLFGVGIGNSVQATGYLPEAINDSVFAIMGETFGFVGLMVILAIFYALLTRILKIMDHLVDMRLKLLAAGVFGWFGAHVILNIASMIGIFPLTGITLPLLSFGGTSMLFIAAALGLVFQLSHYTVHPSRLKEAQNENSSSRRGVGRSRYAGRRSYTRS